MSVEAITWALKQRIDQSSAKFVLVVLANCASAANNLAYPSVQYIVEATSQNRKTVLANLKRLVEAGFIEDAGERRGATRQVVVYRLRVDRFNGGDLVTEWHYVYRSHFANTGQYYLGVRSCYGDPASDTGYLGSGKWIIHCGVHGKQLAKSILAVYPSREAAEEAERAAIAAVFDDVLCMNKVIPSEKRTEKGTVSNDPKNGTASGTGTGPKPAANSPKKSAQQYRKRDTEPLLTASNQSSLKKATPQQREAERKGLQSVADLLNLEAHA